MKQIKFVLAIAQQDQDGERVGLSSEELDAILEYI